MFPHRSSATTSTTAPDKSACMTELIHVFVFVCVCVCVCVCVFVLEFLSRR